MRNTHVKILCLSLLWMIGFYTAPTMATDDCQPQPGAVRGKYVPNGSPPPNSVPGWPDLSPTDATTFTEGTIEAVTLVPPKVTPAGQPKSLNLPIYRVWGGGAGITGRYWAIEKATTESGFYGDYAIELSWNTGQNQATIKPFLWSTSEVAPPFEPIKAWYGLVARQPAEDTCQQIISNYYLPGGKTQVFIPYALPGIDTTTTPWNTKKGGQAQAPTVMVEVPPAVIFPKLGTVVTGEHYAALAERVGQLSQLLRVIAGDSDSVSESSLLFRQADILDRKRAELNSNLASFDAAAAERLKLIASGLVPLSRYLDDTVRLLDEHSAEARQILDDVVEWSYAIEHTPN